MNTSDAPFSKVTRFELIDKTGRRIVLKSGIKLTILVQDEGQTLKVFADTDVGDRWCSDKHGKP